jgi:RimJ/RimL family protein N-acetyltransferase
MRPPEVLLTKRLILRPPRSSDAAPIFHSYAQEPEVTRYVIWEPHKSVQETERFVADCVTAWEGDVRFPWVISWQETDELIGMVEMRINGFKADVGYVIARPFWGQGVATEALRPVVKWALEQESIYRVWALCDTENIGSARVLEKVGMQKEGLLRRYSLHPNISREPRDSYCYAVVK